MSSYLMTADLPILYHPVARTAKGILKSYRSRFQTGRRRDRLERRTRLISIVDTAVPPHLVQRILPVLVGHGCIVSAGIQCKRIVQIKFRDIDHGKDLSILRVHQQDSHFVRLLLLHNLFCHLLGIHLDVIVQADLQRIARNRLHPPFCNAV